MRRYLWAGTVLALLIVTIALFVMSTNNVELGWFAYIPATGEVEGGPGLVIMTRARAAAWLVGALTVVVLAAGAGYAAGRRRSGS